MNHSYSVLWIASQLINMNLRKSMSVIMGTWFQNLLDAAHLVPSTQNIPITIVIQSWSLFHLVPYLRSFSTAGSL